MVFVPLAPVPSMSAVHVRVCPGLSRARAGNAVVWMLGEFGSFGAAPFGPPQYQFELPASEYQSMFQLVSRFSHVNVVSWISISSRVPLMTFAL